jgi:hypothetical protein
MMTSRTLLSTIRALLVLSAFSCGGGAAATRESRPDPDAAALAVIAQIYHDSRALCVTNGIQEYALCADTNLVAACETLLLHYSESAADRVRLAAALRLARFGAWPALARSLDLARLRAAILAQYARDDGAWPRAVPPEGDTGVLRVRAETGADSEHRQDACVTLRNFRAAPGSARTDP